MMGQHPRSESLFYYFRLEDQLPENYLLWLIDKHIDVGFVRERLKESYSETGRPSIDPELLLESRAAEEMIARFAQWQGRKAQSIAADASYGKGEFLQWLMDREITPYMPTRDPVGRTRATSMVRSASST